MAPATKTAAFLAISPGGMAIYHVNDQYQYVNLARRFASDPVSRPFADDYPAYFFRGPLSG
jgi:hypothetical protein